MPAHLYTITSCSQHLLYVMEFKVPPSVRCSGPLSPTASWAIPLGTFKAQGPIFSFQHFRAAVLHGELPTATCP